MDRGSLPVSIGRALPGPFGYDFAPDGLDEAAIDELIEQAYAQVTSASAAHPTWRSAELAEQRRARRKARQIMRALPATMTHPHTGPDGEVAA